MSQPVDPKAYYGYLFETDKKPTKVLDALLRGIAKYITDSIGNKEEKVLSPQKLASFYKAVGGNYDCMSPSTLSISTGARLTSCRATALFVEVPYPSISWIYASIGCQHTLQPANDDFSPPSVPALTTRGFVRWQSIEILLGPEEHVPFIQNAVRNFGIKNPDNGENFPMELPKEAFPLTSDVEVEKWHNSCAEKLRQQASPDQDEEGSRPTLPPRPKVQAGYAHVRPRPDTRDYFKSTSRPISRPLSYQHVSSSGRPVRPTLSTSASHRARQFLAPEVAASPRLSRPRRRSFPENLNSSPIASPAAEPQPVLPYPADQEHVRRHSHPRHDRRPSTGNISSGSSSSDYDDPPSPTSKPAAGTARRRSHGPAHSDHANDPAASPKYRFPPSAGGVTPSVPTPPDPRLRPKQSREKEEGQKPTFAIPIDLTGKLSAPFLADKHERERERDRPARNNSRGGNVRWKDLNDVTEMLRRGSQGPSDDVRRDRDPLSRIHSRDERDRDGARGDYKRREREYDGPTRPRLQVRRSSSHDEVPRRDRDRDYRERERDYRDRDRDRDHDRERDRESGYRERENGGRGVVDGRSYRDRDRENGPSSPLRGVDGRRYAPVDGRRRAGRGEDN